MEHTPGPWRIKGKMRVVDKNENLIADVAWRRNEEQERPNARLVAAAPDLLDVLNEALVDWWGGDDFNEIDDLPESWKVPEWVKKAKVLIAKAKGDEMKPFNLEAAKRGEPIMCRDGTPARFIAHVPDAREGNRVIALIGDMIITAYEDGSRHQRDMETFFDLFMAPKKQTLWLNIYRDSATVYRSEQEANLNANQHRLYGRAYPIEVEE